MDPLLEMVHAMRLTGGIFLEAEFSAPWSVTAKVSPEDCSAYMPTPRHVIAYHYVSCGRCLVIVHGDRALQVEAGEIVVLPRNNDHVLSCGAGIAPVRADDLIQPGPEGSLARIIHGGGGEKTDIFCGFLASDRPPDALIALLPPLLKLRIADLAGAGWIESSLRYAAAQVAGGEAGSSAMLARLAELLLAEAVRRYFASQSVNGQKQVAGLADPAVGKALSLIHGQIGHRWSTEELAREAAMSRSAFAERFTRVIGEPPMRYLARMRFERAMAQMLDSSHRISHIAHEVGYESEEAFSRAFRREYGMPPATWRRSQASADA